MRKWILAGVLVALMLGAAGRVLWKASKPVFLGSIHGRVRSEHDGVAETYRDLGGFGVSRWRYRQWFEEHDFITLSGCVVADQPGTTTGVGGSRVGSKSTGSPSSVIWTANVGLIGDDDRTVDPKVEIMIRYDLEANAVTLLNTGETLPLSSDKVYVAYVNRQFQVDRFVALDPATPLKGAHPKLVEAFARLKDDSLGIAEQGVPPNDR